MLTGRFIHRIIPYLQTGTHFTVNRLASRLIKKRVPKHFPDWRSINEHEGLQGIDGLWLQNQHDTSRSAYNPLTNQGLGLAEVDQQFQLLVDAWANNDTQAIARQLAYVSHVITDVCTPPHQHGSVSTPKRRYWYAFWVRDDWQETDTGESMMDRHWQFEMSLLYRLIWKPFKRSRLNKRILQRIVRQRERPRQALRGYLQRLTWQIRSLNLYQEFMDRGWTSRIDRSMRQVVMPSIVSTVATTWYLGAIEGEARRLGTRKLTYWDKGHN